MRAKAILLIIPHFSARGKGEICFPKVNVLQSMQCFNPQKGVTAMPFAHLHLHSEYSLLDGANRIKPLVKRLKELGFTHAAITDHGVMYGVVEFYSACMEE
ncbi:MAG: PHP domain-containing protein, partial [Clostridia bacterium]